MKSLLQALKVTGKINLKRRKILCREWLVSQNAQDRI